MGPSFAVSRRSPANRPEKGHPTSPDGGDRFRHNRTAIANCQFRPFCWFAQPIRAGNDYDSLLEVGRDRPCRLLTASTLPEHTDAGGSEDRPLDRQAQPELTSAPA